MLLQITLVLVRRWEVCSTQSLLCASATLPRTQLSLILRVVSAPLELSFQLSDIVSVSRIKYLTLTSKTAAAAEMLRTALGPVSAKHISSLMEMLDGAQSAKLRANPAMLDW